LWLLLSGLSVVAAVAVALSVVVAVAVEPSVIVAVTVTLSVVVELPAVVTSVESPASVPKTVKQLDANKLSGLIHEYYNTRGFPIDQHKSKSYPLKKNIKKQKLHAFKHIFFPIPFILRIKTYKRT
jgi:hypothetical protein